MDWSDTNYKLTSSEIYEGLFWGIKPYAGQEHDQYFTTVIKVVRHSDSTAADCKCPSPEKFTVFLNQK